MIFGCKHCTPKIKIKLSQSKCFNVPFIQTNLYCITLLNKAELLFYTERKTTFKYQKIWPKSCCVHVGIKQNIQKKKKFPMKKHDGMHSKMHRDASGESANQSAAWGKGWGSGAAQCCTAKLKWRYNTTCTRRVQIDAQENWFSSTQGGFLLVLSEACRLNPWCKIKEWFKMWCYQMSCVCFSILDFKCSLYARMSLFHLVMVWFSHTQISWATWKEKQTFVIMMCGKAKSPVLAIQIKYVLAELAWSRG